MVSTPDCSVFPAKLAAGLLKRNVPILSQKPGGGVGGWAVNLLSFSAGHLSPPQDREGHQGPCWPSSSGGETFQDPRGCLKLQTVPNPVCAVFLPIHILVIKFNW